jgi:GSH-dependent disulfide-bond oxidoreductase
MTDNTTYIPPKICKWSKENGGQFANIHRPLAGPTHDLPRSLSTLMAHC